MAQAGTTIHYRGKKENTQAVKSTEGAGHVFTYKPTNKNERKGRERVWERFNAMKDDDIRNEEMRQWDLGMKMVTMWAPDRDPEDWRADIILPDAFSAIQSHMQETVQLRPRPLLEGVESTDADLEHFCNSIFQYAMDQTEFDAETHKARNCAAAKGTAYTREEYRYETRDVQDPSGYADGKITYTKKEIIDYDDVYTRHIRNEAVFTDPGAEDPKYLNDWVYREVIDYDTFMELYEGKDGFKNVDEVVPAGSLNKSAGFFKIAEDMTGKDVELLHYENKLTDSYDVLANNVLIRQGPLPSKHKELSLDVWTFYPTEGRCYGMGIPKIIYSLVEERRSIRNISLDRQKMQISKMFLVNDLFDLDEDDLTPRPHGMVRVNTNGLPISQAVFPLEYGDVPASSGVMDENLLSDERRAHGMDDRPAISAGGTATEAAITKEGAQARINLINQLSMWNTLLRLGKKKWSNIQFFYPAPRMVQIVEDNKVKEKQVYRTIKVKGQTYNLIGGDDDSTPTQVHASPYNGISRMKLDPAFARFMGGDYDVVVDAQSMVVVSKAIKTARVNEMTGMILGNPILIQRADPDKILKRLVMVNDEDPKDWMRDGGMTEQDMIMVADQENMLFANMAVTGKLYLIPGTPGATESHTLEHINLTETKAYDAWPNEVKAALRQHILEENDNNPNVASSQEAIQRAKTAAGLPGGAGVPTPGGGGATPPPGPPQGGGGNAVPPGGAGGPNVPQPSQTPVVAGGDVTAGNQ